MKKALLTGFFVLGICMGFSGSAIAEQGVTDDEIIIGSHQDLSGPATGMGTQVKIGMEMRVKEINDAGGIHGRKIRLIVEDNGYDPKKAILATNKMINRDKVFCFLSNFGTPTAVATKQIISKKKIPQIFPMSSSSLFFEPYDRYSFGGAVPTYDQSRALIKYFNKTKGYKRVGIMYQDDDYGLSAKKGVEDQLKMYGQKLVAAESYKRGATDFSSQIAKLKKTDVELLVLATVIRETVGALKEVRKLNWTVDICGSAGTYNPFVPLLCMKAGISPEGLYAVGQVPFIYEDSPHENVRVWFKKFVEWYGKKPDLYVAAGYHTIYYFEKMAKECGRDLTREKLIDIMENYGTFPDDMFHGLPITYTSTNHQGAFGTILNQIQNGKYVKVAYIPDFK